jgi:hypothetical protein
MKGWAKAGSVAGVSCFVGNDGFPKGRGDGILSFPPRAVFAIVTRIARRGEFDQQFDRGGSVERLDSRVRRVQCGARGLVSGPLP